MRTIEASNDILSSPVIVNFSLSTRASLFYVAHREKCAFLWECCRAKCFF